MIDAFGLPPSFKNDQQIFRATPDANSWQQWMKPKGCSMIYMLCIGSGSGGGAGLSGADNTARGGGAGGGAGAMASIILPAFLVPDYLWVQPGIGGAGGASSGNAGANGSHSYISVVGSLSSSNPASNLTTGASGIWLVSGATVAQGGGAGTTTTSAGGAGETVITTASAIGATWGLFQAQPGITGAAGGSGAGNNAGANATSTPKINTSPGENGAGGGSCAVTTSTSNNGGRNVVSLPWFGEGQQGGQPTINGGFGPPGWTIWNPFLSVGGCGGASIHAGTGGNGGAGGLTAGGGGGGAGVTGGAGGPGGDGIVVICCW